MIPSKKSTLVVLTALALLMAACSGLKTSTTSGGTGSGTTYTVSGSISGLVGSGLVLTDTINGSATNTLTVAANASTFTFTTAVPSGETYAVTVTTQPTNPGQNCVVTTGTGTASANVTSVAIACTTNPVTATIGGTVSGLQGTGLILQNNGGDSLTIAQNGTFTFTTPVTGPTDAYAVTVLDQPTGPLQICTVASGSGTASANVTNVSVTCVLAYTIGGNVTGLTGTGLVLQNTGAEQLPITANGAFTFKNPVPTGFAFTISVYTQPTVPAQTCTITQSTASGTATANVTNVTVNCPAVTYSVGGTVVGLEGVKPNNGPLTDNSFTLENELGNTLIVTENGTFTFATPVALNDQYQVSVFTSASTQTQGCTVWGYKGTVTANVTNVTVDCAHNDWTWIDGVNLAGTIATPQYGSDPASAPLTFPNPYTNTPGARYGGAGWTDKFGNLWLFGGNGWELAGNATPSTYFAPMNDLWVCVMYGDQCQWQLVGAYNTTYGAAIYANAQNEGQVGTSTVPGGRYGAATWTDSSGNFWLFGGNGNNSANNGLLNDMWEFNTSVFAANTTPTYQNNGGTWSSHGGSTTLVNQAGVYPPTANPFPGSRVNAFTWTDASGNFWMFGGYGYDGTGTVGYLNDLWEYSGGAWAFIGGTSTANQKGNYGTQGTPLSSNLPGGRHEGAAWSDAFGNLWLFGGEGEDSVGTTDGILSDLWVYNITNNQWTFVMGSTTANVTGNYGLAPFVGPVSTTGAAGTVGVPTGSSGTFPGSRWGPGAWTDAGGNFWLFGGWGLDSGATNGNGSLNDLWVYTPNTTATQPGTWSWIKGSNTGAENGVYGTLGRPYLTYDIWTPGGRAWATHWVDSNGQLWLFGGEGYDSTSTNGNGFLNDMWRYLPYPN
jgi:hypothetical protein